MKNIMPHRMMMAGLLALALATTPARGDRPMIMSFGSNGELVCTNLLPGSTASVVRAVSVLGPWTSTSSNLDAVTVDASGAIQVIVPMTNGVSTPGFYRVRGVPSTNSALSGMALIPAGDFTMGDTFGEGYSDELPLHTNYVSAFYMDKYGVTKALWDEVYNWATNHGYSFEYGAQGKATNQPVQYVTWYDCVKWCNARSERAGQTPAYYTNAVQTAVYRTKIIDLATNWVNWTSGYRLPTEAEREKAARGGASGQRYPWGDTISWSQANYYSQPASAGGYPYDLNSTAGYNPAYTNGTTPYTSPPGALPANGYGLCDMAGNVWEWCWDWYGPYPSGSQVDPLGPASGRYRVGRGGSWDDYPYNCRISYRYDDYPTYQRDYLGFRCVLSPGQ